VDHLLSPSTKRANGDTIANTATIETIDMQSMKTPIATVSARSLDVSVRFWFDRGATFTANPPQKADC
jgi:hypothetical protein